MSETTSEGSSPPGGGLYDEAGHPLQSGRREQPTEDLIRFAQDHPVATTLSALVLGYILGKLF